MKNNFYLTTTLPYVNGIPHIGHTLEFIQADVIVRFMRSTGADVYFNVGTDEHGLKNFEKATELKMDVKRYVDDLATKWVEFCKIFGISYDRFIRTTDKDHYESATRFWNASLENGDIYKKHYEGLYCVGCEEFKTEKDLVDGKCVDHNKEPIVHSEENYFFKFSKYQEGLLDLYKRNSKFIRPIGKLQEMISFVGRGLDDFSISRRKENLPWGVPVPGDDEQVMYVWFDALVNYVTTIGYGVDEEMFNKWWPAVQLCGPDNNRFQSAMWQAMLMSVGIEPSKQILVHGMVLGEDGTKMSKSKGNVISPFDLVELYGVEPVRYYLIAGIPTYSDSAFSHEHLKSKYKADLMNNFGNLLNRVITLINKFNVNYEESMVGEEFKQVVNKIKDEYNAKMSNFDLFEAMSEVQKLGETGNVYITEKAPWEKGKTEEEISQTLINLHYLLDVIITCYDPVIPESTKKARAALDNMENIILFNRIDE